MPRLRRSYQRAAAPPTLRAAVFDRRAACDSHASRRSTNDTMDSPSSRDNDQHPGTEACIIGGGVAAAGNALLDPVRRQLPDFTWPTLLSRTDVVSAELGNDAGLIGAASLALEALAA